jgi:Leucine-rich repeat (LRR) protein
MTIDKEIEFKFLIDPTIVDNIDLDDANEAKQFNSNTFDNLNKNLKNFRFLLNFTQLNMNDQILQQSIAIKFLHLKELDLSYSQIKRIKTNTLSRLINLESLKLKKCRIKIIENDSFKNMNRLIHLDLSSNRLKKINSSKIFNGLINLKYLSLNSALCDNMIKHPCVKFITDDSFFCLHNLEVLDLSKNRIQKITVRTFYGLNNLKTIYFGHCRIKSIEDNSFKCLTKLENLFLTDNESKYFNYLTHSDCHQRFGLNRSIAIKCYQTLS